MAEDIKEALNVEVKLESGDRGEFSVWHGKVLICKKTLDGYPASEEVIKLLKADISKQ